MQPSLAYRLVDYITKKYSTRTSQTLCSRSNGDMCYDHLVCGRTYRVGYYILSSYSDGSNTLRPYRSLANDMGLRHPLSCLGSYSLGSYGLGSYSLRSISL